MRTLINEMTRWKDYKEAKCWSECTCTFRLFSISPAIHTHQKRSQTSQRLVERCRLHIPVGKAHNARILSNVGDLGELETHKAGSFVYRL